MAPDPAIYNLPTSQPPPLTILATIAALLIAALWGAMPTAIKFSADALPPIAGATVRFGIATFVLGGWCAITGQKLWPRRNEILALALIGLLTFAQILLFTLAVDWSNASHATIVINTYIFMVIFLEHFVTKTDRLTILKALGLIACAMGALLTLSASGFTELTKAMERTFDSSSLTGDLTMLVSAAVLSITILATKITVQTVTPIKLVFWKNTLTIPLFLTVSLYFEGTFIFHTESYTHPVLWSLAYQGIIVSTFCVVVRTHLLQRYSATQISTFNFSTPLFGLLFAVLLRHDPVTMVVGISACCIAIGIYLVTNSRTSRIVNQV
jgi:drug/metabolite transporter (DMT)-like permease